MDQRTRYLAILIVLLFGLVTLAVEVRHEHRHTLAEHPQAWIPIVYSCLAALASLVALRDGWGPRMAGCLVFAAGTLVGPIGAFLHTEGDVGRVGSVFVQDALVARADEDGDEEEGRRPRRRQDDRESEAPPLAPLAISGLSAIGFLACWPGKRRDS